MELDVILLTAAANFIIIIEIQIVYHAKSVQKIILGAILLTAAQNALIILIIIEIQLYHAKVVQKIVFYA